MVRWPPTRHLDESALAGQFVEVYEAAIADGATEILSIHIAEAMSGTLNSARLAAESVSVPVNLVDSGTASFGISVCAWAAAVVVAAGGSIGEAVAMAQTRAADWARPSSSVCRRRLNDPDVSTASTSRLRHSTASRCCRCPAGRCPC